MRVPRLVTLDDGKEVLIAYYSKNGMPYVSLVDLLNLPDLTVENQEDIEDEIFLSDNNGTDPVELLHQRCGHYSKIKTYAFHGIGAW